MNVQTNTVTPSANNRSDRVRKHSIKLFGVATSLSLEQTFWHHLKAMADDNALTVAKQIEAIKISSNCSNLSSGIRVAVLNHFKQNIG